jgi:hypothetical protein
MLLTLPLLQLTTPTTTPTAFSFLPFFLSVCARVRYFKSLVFFLHFSFFRYFLTPIAMHGAIIIKYM